MKTLKLKEERNKFRGIKVTGDVRQFDELLDFCGDQITIQRKNAEGIGCFWDIQLEDDIKEKTITVPNGSYILNINECFTCVSNADMLINFEEII